MRADTQGQESSGAIELPPWDDHNRALIANVHPADWVNPTPDGRYNLVVIGGGTAGLVTASAAEPPAWLRHLLHRAWAQKSR